MFKAIKTAIIQNQHNWMIGSSWSRMANDVTLKDSDTDHLVWTENSALVEEFDDQHERIVEYIDR